MDNEVLYFTVELFGAICDMSGETWEKQIGPQESQTVK